MKRITRLTESDLMRIIKRVIKEQEDDDIETFSDFYKKYPLKQDDDESLDKRMNALYGNPKLVAKLKADGDRSSKISNLKDELRVLDKQRNRIIQQLNDLGYNA